MKPWALFFTITYLLNSALGAAEKDLQNLFKNYLIQNPIKLMWDWSNVDRPLKDPKLYKAQAFIDKVDAQLRQEFPELKLVPHPVVAIDQGRLNAHVDAVHVCYQLPLPIALDGATPTENEEPLIYPNTNGTFFSASLNNCDRHSKIKMNDLPDLFRLIQWNNGCELTVDSTGKKIVFNTGCKIGGDLKHFKITQSKNILINQTQNVVWISSDLFNMFSNKKYLNAILAHELGHIYLAHPSKLENGFYRYFKFSDRIPFQNPSPLSELDAAYYATKEPANGIADLPFYSKVLGREDDYSVKKDVVIQYLQRSVDGQIAKYSTETIADEFSLLILKMMHINSNEALESFINLRTPQKTVDAFEFDQDQCLELFQNEWQQGKITTYVPWGDYMEIHPSGCHRAYNMMRNILFLNGTL